MKKRNFCEETKRVVYTVEREKTSHCKLDCTINLFPEEDGILPYALIERLKSKYIRKPNPKEEEEKINVPSIKIEHEFSDVFSVHIETKATCQEGDVFDAKRGETIAYSKAQYKLYNLMKRMYEDIDNFFSEYGRQSVTAKLMFDRYTEREGKFIKGI